MKHIKMPTFHYRGQVINILELRLLQIERAKGNLKSCKIVDEKGIVAYIDENGSLSASLYGLEIETDLKFDLLKLRQKKRS
jgi:hypothetical protein